MRIIKVGVIDYGMGNHASVKQTLRELGYRSFVSSNLKELDSADVLVLPGVGAFPAAMQALKKLGLDDYLQRKQKHGYPIIGICLGMQLLTSASNEFEYIQGLDLIPGEFICLDNKLPHIGWNTISTARTDTFFFDSIGDEFYFNHSYAYSGPKEYQVAIVHHMQEFAACIQHEKVVGLQFHPEKSQLAGKSLMKRIICGLLDD